MTAPTGNAALDLAALLASRICHDIISPVSVVLNGLEMLEEEDDPAMREEALGLIRQSAAQASTKLKFARMAFGASGSTGSGLDLAEAVSVARSLIETDRLSLVIDAPAAIAEKTRVKLLLALMLYAAQAVPRGGRLTIVLEPGAGDDPLTGFSIRADGPQARLPDGVGLLSGEAETAGVDARSVLPHYAGLLAATAGLRLSAAMDGEAVVFLARPA